MAMSELTAAGVRPGDDVVVPAYGGAEVAVAVRESGARPVFADIDPRTYCLDPSAVEKALTPSTVAVAVVHLFGHPADLVCLHSLAQRRNIRLVEADPLPSVESLDAVRRRQYAGYLDAGLRGVEPPFVATGAAHAFTDYVVRVPGNGRPDRDAFLRALRGRGVECRVPVKTPAHRTTGFRSGVQLPHAECAADETLALPLRASMTKRELQRVVSACNSLGGLLVEPAC